MIRVDGLSFSKSHTNARIRDEAFAKLSARELWSASAIGRGS